MKNASADLYQVFERGITTCQRRGARVTNIYVKKAGAGFFYDFGAQFISNSTGKTVKMRDMSRALQIVGNEYVKGISVDVAREVSDAMKRDSLLPLSDKAADAIMQIALFNGIQYPL